MTRGAGAGPDEPRQAGKLGRDAFAYDSPRHAFFWMKNTLIPLDMIFADATGQVTRVHEGAVPLDETSIDGGDGVAYVLEINGGLARAAGCDPGCRHAVGRHRSGCRGLGV